RCLRHRDQSSHRAQGGVIMGVYHLLVQSFPIVLWNTAFLFILIRVFSDGSLAQSLAKAVTTLIFLGVLGGVVTYALGFLVWPWGALSSSPLGRNHFLLATWTVDYWTVLLIFVWRLGDALWRGATRWITLLLSAFGVVLLNITGTLGGSVAHNASAVSDVVRYVLGWEIYTTFYSPDPILWMMVLVSAVLIGIGVWGTRRYV
ncbi:MAG: DUF2231 domain-containing protein, partial [Haliea sp.]